MLEVLVEINGFFDILVEPLPKKVERYFEQLETEKLIVCCQLAAGTKSVFVGVTEELVGEVVEPEFVLLVGMVAV